MKLSSFLSCFWLFPLFIGGHNSFSQQWEYAPLRNEAQLNAGLIGGEGGQWPQALAVDRINGQIMLQGSDVGGLWRSLNGGELWEPANNGFTPRGTSGLFIDPKNPGRAIAVGSNSSKAILSNYHGLYLTTDTASTWSQVLLDNASGYRDIREQIAFDPASFDEELGYCTIIYYSRISRNADSEGGTGTLEGALYQSVNGGQNWAKLPNTTAHESSVLKVHPTNGTLFVANKDGFFRSTDQGAAFTQTFTGHVKGFDVSVSDPVKIYLTTSNKLYISNDNGLTFDEIAAVGYTSHANYLRVSPANDQYLITQHDNPATPYNTYYLYSHNGGLNWNRTTDDKSMDFLPRNLGRMMYPSWHPTDENIVFAVGGDFITQSTDGGASIVWANNGASQVMVYGMLNFNLDNPDLFFFSAQDYDASVSLNGGETFKYLGMSGHGWGGDIHGGYVVDSLTWFGRRAEGWGEQETDIRITFDGGQSYLTQGKSNGYPSCYGVPGDRNILFAGDMRSEDRGQTWQKMVGCDGVLASNPVGDNELYGVFQKRYIVKSIDKGVTWSEVAKLDYDIRDLAYDPIGNALYAACYESGLWKIFPEEIGIWDLTSYTPTDLFNRRRFSTVTVDPVDPLIVYAGGTRDIYSNDISVIRSTDGGYTWLPLTVDVRHNNSHYGMSAGREAMNIRVNPQTRHAWVGTSCYGLWKIAQPDSLPTPAPRMRLNRPQLSLLVDDIFQMEAIFEFTDETPVTWSVSHPQILEVDENGLVTALEKGTATVTAVSTEAGLSASCAVTVASPKGPFGGELRVIPGKIETEDFDEGGQDVGYYDTTLQNEGGMYRPDESVGIETCSEGGFNVGWTEAGEWLSYSVLVDSTAAYDINVRASVNTAARIEIVFSQGDVSTGEISMAPTGGWQSWQTFTKRGVQLNAGEQEMLIRYLTGGFNCNYIDIQPASTVSVADQDWEIPFSLFPNPFKSGNLALGKGDFPGIAEVTIFDMIGKRLFSAKIDNEQIFIPRNLFQNGIYVVTFRGSSVSKTFKLIVH